MTAITVTVTISGEFHPRIDDSVIAEWIDARLNDGRNTFITNASRGGGGGRTYGRHTASAPGEYPATDSGRLVGSVDTQMNSDREGELFSDVEYARYLAGGTSRMAPRKMVYEALTEALDARPDFEALAAAVKFDGGGA